MQDHSENRPLCLRRDVSNTYVDTFSRFPCILFYKYICRTFRTDCIWRAYDTWHFHTGRTMNAEIQIVLLSKEVGHEFTNSLVYTYTFTTASIAHVAFVTTACVLAAVTTSASGVSVTRVCMARV